MTTEQLDLPFAAVKRRLQPQMVPGSDHMAPVGNKGVRHRFARYVCPYCGKEFVTRVQGVKSGHCRSCGCQQGGLKHGRHGTPTYRTWRSMIQRCVDPNVTEYPYYGGRGITVCERWRNSFENFLTDMGERPPGMQIDRIDNNAGYKPGNCRWVTPSINTHNRRARSDSRSRFKGITLKGKRWSASIKVNGKTYNLKGFETEEKAAAAYNSLVLKFLGPRFPLNDV